MKKIIFPGVFLALLLIFSCSKDEFTEEDATKAQKDVIHYQDSIDQVRDSLRMIGGIIQYSVSVIPIDANTGFVGGNYKSANDIEMLDSAKVSVAQHGIVKSVYTDETGIAVFHDLRVGTVNVSVQVDGYTNVNFIAEINHDPVIVYDDTIYYELFHAATMVPVFSLEEGTSTISGRVTLETDLTNTSQELPDEPVNVIASLDIDDHDFRENYFSSLWNASLSDLHGVITQAAYAGLTVSEPTDATGFYELEVPSSADGLPFILEIDDYVTDQTLLMDTMYGIYFEGTYDVRTIFSTNTEFSEISHIPTAPAAYVNFSPPTGVVTQQPVEKASATAVVGESGISSIIINDQGNGYTQAPYLEITTDGNGTGAEAVAYLTEGKVTSIEITNPGKGYHMDDDIEVIAHEKLGDNASAEAVVTYSVTGFTNTSGDGYQSVPEVVVQSNSGSGATGKAIMSGYVTKFTVTNMGSGYTCYPDVVVAGSSNPNTGASTGAVADVNMTQYNPIHSIVMDDDYLSDPDNFFESAPVVVIGTNGTGSGATAIVQLGTKGQVERIELSNAGFAYTEAPTINIAGDGQGAAAWADLNADGSINIYLEAGGFGYTTATISISAPPVGGVQAIADAVLSYLISSIVITNPGSGYDIVVNSSTNAVSNEPELYFAGQLIDEDDYVASPSMKVESIDVDDSGDYYENAPSVTIVPSCGYGSGATATAEILSYVDKVEVLTPGSGYNYNADITVTIITPPEGCLEQATVSSVTLGDGVLSSIILVDGGENYMAPPHVTLYVSNSAYDNDFGEIDAEIEAVFSNGEIISFNILNGGEGYGYWNGYDINISTSINQVDLGAVPYPESGKISFVTIDNPGAGYATEPMVRFIRYNVNGDEISDAGFTAAEAVVELVDGRVVAIDVTNPGTGYYSPPVVDIYVPDYLEQALGKCILSEDGSGYITGVQLVDTDGNNVVVSGMGYSEAPSVTFTASVPGFGTGATGTAVIKDGAVVNVIMTNNGLGYLGRNYPTVKQEVQFLPDYDDSAPFMVYAGKSYIRDIYLGTGKRTIED
ncbi:MAG: hypothetical protein JEZ09_02760 [Salinivirgaceae bacterium]|nr:hypothetical protein [Salinivirgaceae bacterium]